MNLAENNGKGSGKLPTSVAEPPEEKMTQPSTQTAEPAVADKNDAFPPKFATRSDARAAEGVSKGKLMLLGGGLALAVLFFVFAAVVGKSTKRPSQVKPAIQTQQAKRNQGTPSQSSVTPLMDVPRTSAPDNTGGQIRPADIRRTRSLDDGTTAKPFAGKPAVATSLGSVPSFADTQQK